MTDIAELTAEKLEEIRQRYRPTLAPKCHICGVEMTIQRMSASRITYGCAGAIYDETGCHYAEGRSLADDHYAESRITVVDVSDPDVLAMVEALEKAQQRIAELDRKNCELDSLTQRWAVERAENADHIAELESRLESADKLQDSAFRSGLQHGFSLGQTDDQKGYEQSMAAYSPDAGIKVEAE